MSDTISIGKEDMPKFSPKGMKELKFPSVIEPDMLSRAVDVAALRESNVRRVMVQHLRGQPSTTRVIMTLRAKVNQLASLNSSILAAIMADMKEGRKLRRSVFIHCLGPAMKLVRWNDP